MSPSRNDDCPCGSGRKFKKCCGKPAEPTARSSPAPPPIPLSGILGLERFGDSGSDDPFEVAMVDLARRGNIALAEVRIRERLARESSRMNSETIARSFNMLGWIASAANLLEHASRHFDESIAAYPAWQLPRGSLERIQRHAATAHTETTPDARENKFLLIKAWGFGFWSDVSHVIGQLLVARLTNRTPIVHWGANSLFSSDPSANAWTEFFEPVSGVTVADLVGGGFDCWPPKWTAATLTTPEVSKWKGPYSRVAGLWGLARGERVLVTDFFAGINDLLPWIPPENPLHGQTVHEIARCLVRDHLRPQRAILNEVDAFCAARFSRDGYLAVHARGSDKALELADLDGVNREYHARIAKHLEGHPAHALFLMTDDERILAHYRATYGDRVVTTECARTATDTGTHYLHSSQRRRLGVEVLIDTLVASRANAFIGNGFSNASVVVRYLKDWKSSECTLIGPNLFETANPVLHAW
ncbi:MAG: hypothetical protein EXS03_06735 [Phycisphaerales bacterium]|nr:hypothetical protein [Phycisphaerales bacterium]